MKKQNETIEIVRKIQGYLCENGKMSGYDICTDLNVTETDVCQAAIDGYILNTSPLPGGSAPWYLSAPWRNT